MTPRSMLYCLLSTALIAGCSAGDSGEPQTAQQSDNSPRHEEWVKIESETGIMLDAYCVYPEADGPTLSVIVIHENRGMTDWVRTVVDRLTAEGFLAIAPDMLSGKGPDGSGSAGFASGDDLRQALRDLTMDEKMQNLRAVVRYARELPATSEQVAVAGFCWGGSHTFAFAAKEPSLAAAFVFYGTYPGDDQLAEIQCPVYGFYGGNDNRVNATIPDTETAMERLGKLYEPEIYAGAGHGFMRAGAEPDATPENRAAMEAGWDRWLGLLRGM